MSIVLLSAGLFTAPTTGALGERYQITLIPTPVEAQYSRAMTINAQGHVAGVYSATGGPWGGWYWNRHEVFDIRAPGFSSVLVRDINDSAVVVGRLNADSNTHQLLRGAAFMWDLDQGLRTMPTSNVLSRAEGINNHGVVVGGIFMEGAVWRGGEAFILPRPCHGSWWVTARAINDTGVIVATCELDVASTAWMYDLKGKWTRLDGLSWPEAINAKGNLVVGATGLAGYWRPAKWLNGVAMSLPGFESNAYGAAIDLNEGGDIVGYVYFRSRTHAVLWKGDGRLMDLNQHIPPNSGWHLLAATGINDSGQIVGYGTRNNIECAFLLTPE